MWASMKFMPKLAIIQNYPQCLFITSAVSIQFSNATIKLTKFTVSFEALVSDLLSRASNYVSKFYGPEIQEILLKQYLIRLVIT